MNGSQHRRFDEARRLQQAGRVGMAASVFESLLRELPGHPDLLESMGRLLLNTGRLNDAESHLRRAVSVEPRRATAWRAIAQALRLKDDLENALDAVEKASAISPDDPANAGQHAELLMLAGRHDEAASIVRPRIERGGRHPALLIAYADLAVRLGVETHACELLDLGARDPKTPPLAKTAFLFRRGRLLERLGEYDDAFVCWRDANSPLPRFNESAMRRAVDAHLAWWSRDRLESAPSADTDGAFAIFIIGMPRSGTSLTEQILSMHPGVYAGGERPVVHRVVAEHGLLPGESDRRRSLDIPLIDELSKEVLDDMRACSTGAEHITDKLPTNFFHVPLLSKIAPGCRIVHCVRDPMDTCLSCYANNFTPPMPFANDLNDLGAYYTMYRRAMDRWREIGVETHELVYEELAREPEREIRRLLDFIGLGFDEVCLRPHESSRVTFTASSEQVRRPINTGSVGRWRRFERHLDPLRDALGTLGSDA